MTLSAATRPQWAVRVPESSWLRMEHHVALLGKWNAAINLVAPAGLEEVWSRHVLDSVQIFDLRGANCRLWADFGSGAGFPGMVVAFLARDLAPDMRVTLVESDRRKAEFLRTVSRETGVAVTVLDARIEILPPLLADVVSARALALLPVLCGYAERHLAPRGAAVFPKGARARAEVCAARQDWHFDLETIPSRTDPDASILRLTDLRRA